MMTQTKSHKNSEHDFQSGVETSQENQKGISHDKTIGAFLREEREKKGLNYEKICELTRLRPPILNALENESWESLPSFVFVSGFVRSYSRALQLDEEKVMALFRQSRPSEVFSFKPLIEPVRNSRKKLVIVILIVGLLALASAYFFWKGFTPFDRFWANLMLIHSAEKIKETPREIEPVTSDEKLPLVAPVPETNPKSGDIEQDDNLSKKEAASTDSPVITASDGIQLPELILKASFREMTWLRIFVDDQDSKEYIFRTQEHFEWKAKKGFDLLIGNAGGIDLELNGVRVENHGTAGQVVHLTLPKGYERRNQQD